MPVAENARCRQMYRWMEVQAAPNLQDPCWLCWGSNKHTPSGYLSVTHCPFDKTKNKFDYYRGKSCMKNFCLDLREHATKIINYEKKEMIP